MPITSVRSGLDERADLFPAELLPLFDSRFIVSWDLFEEYIARLALQIFRSIGLERPFEDAATVRELVGRAQLDPLAAPIPVAWILSILAARGWIRAEKLGADEIRYRADARLPELDPNEILVAQQAHDPTCLPSYSIAALAADQYPAVLRGQISGEQALFGPEGISAWVKYFANTNPLYAISNTVGAITAQRSLAGFPGAILELGGGLGSGAQAILDRLAPSGPAKDISCYHFTEISPLFLKRAERTLSPSKARCEFVFSRLNIDRPFSEADVAPKTYALVYGVNVLHVAVDLEATLHEIRECLQPGGTLVIAECVRPFPDIPLHLELVFNLLASFRDPVLVPEWRPNGGFLTTEQWTAAFAANGFDDVRCYPDIANIRDSYPSFSIAAITGKRR